MEGLRMPKSKTIKLYEFDELDESVQDNIISAYVQDLPGWWSDEIEERIKNEARAIGIQDFDFTWSGFWSQGDGLSFTGLIDFKTWLYILQQRYPDWADKSSDSQGYKTLGTSLYDVVDVHEKDLISWGPCKIHRHNHMYCHENTVNAILSSNIKTELKEYWDFEAKFLGKVQKCLNEWKNELCQRWYAELQEAYESYTERDNIVEDINGRELLYTSSGTIIDNGELV